MGHTPTPWRATVKQGNVIVNEGGDKWIARALIGNKRSPRFIRDPDVAEANAAYIVECVNSHASLVEEVERLREALKVALPRLEDNARLLRDIQAHNSQIAPAFEAVKVVKGALNDA